MSYEKKFLALKKKLKKASPSENVRKKSSALKEVQSPIYEKKWLALGLKKEKTPFGSVYVRRKVFKKDDYHGRYQLSLFEKFKQYAVTEEVPEPMRALSKPFLFFDTETTGLRGSGTLIFLVGLLHPTEDGYVLTQYLLPSPAHEEAFLMSLPFYQQSYNVVTYNGKSFDWPQLESRSVMYRHSLDTLQTQHLIDLLHVARRVFKKEATRFRLDDIEEELLHFYRPHDIPGHLIPIIYQDAVKSGEPQALYDVFIHNEWDVLSLAVLYGRMLQLIIEKKKTTETIEANISEWLFDLRAYDHSQERIREALQQFIGNDSRLYYYAATLLRKQKATEEAYEAYLLALPDAPPRQRQLIYDQLAKIAEHSKKNIKLAQKWTIKGQETLINTKQELTSKFYKRMQKEWKHREKRLAQKEEALCYNKNKR